MYIFLNEFKNTKMKVVYNPKSRYAIYKTSQGALVLARVDYLFLVRNNMQSTLMPNTAILLVSALPT
jgi:hypothetical protein